MKSSGSQSVTLVTPTHNRSSFLRRMLYFFQEIQFAEPLLIVDSSDSIEAERNLSVIELFRPSLSITYQHYDLDFMKKCCRALAEIETPYVSFCADDDFSFPKVVQDCVAFLDQHNDYATAQGNVIHVSNACSHQKSIFTCSLKESYDINQEDPVDRFVAMSNRVFSTFYAIYRTPLLTRAFDLTEQHTDYQKARVFTEAMLVRLSAIAGKIKVLPQIQYIQETHGTNESRVLPRIVDRGRVESLYRRYQQGLVDELARVSDCGRKEIQEMVEQQVGVLPGVRGASTIRSIHLQKKLIREARRIVRKVTALLDRQWSKRCAQAPSTVLRDADVLPAIYEYQLAAKLLIQFPNGMDAPSEKVDSQAA